MCQRAEGQGTGDSNQWEVRHGRLAELSAKLETRSQGHVSQAWGMRGGRSLGYKREGEKETSACKNRLETQDGRGEGSPMTGEEEQWRSQMLYGSGRVHKRNFI